MTPATRRRTDREVRIPVHPHALPGTLTLPDEAVGLVLFVHGSGSNRASPRNLSVADVLQAAGLATLRFDLLTDAESRDRRNVFDLPLLAGRLLAATHWVARQSGATGLPLGYFGASTGGGAALIAAASAGEGVRAVVSRGGRPDLALDWLPRVRAASLLIVGALDTDVLELNRLALEALQCRKELAVVPGATHLFEEPGTLERVAALATAWFLRHLPPPAPAGP